MTDNFKNPRITDLYNNILMNLTTFFNNPYQGMSEKNMEELLKEINSEVNKLNSL